MPADYRAAGVIFYTRTAGGEVALVLLGVEERKVSLREMGAGSGTRRRRVLLFPQGKREPSDRGFVDTARREFVEETEDPSGLAVFLDAAAAGEDPPLPSTWLANAKMAVVFCEVPPDRAVDGDQPSKQLQLRPVWVPAADLCRALASASAGTEVRTELGEFPLFPVTRRFLQTAAVQRWLGMARPAVAARPGPRRR